MVRIDFGDLIIGNISDSSGVFSGDNLQVKWKAYIKADEGFGILEGDENKSLNNQSVVIRSCSPEK
ncbi:MAG: hypothetical protein ACM3TR_11025 [Caulobacteraceae bacterium]